MARYKGEKAFGFTSRDVNKWLKLAKDDEGYKNWERAYWQKKKKK